MKKIMSVRNILISTVLLTVTLLLVIFSAVGCSPDMGLHGACVSISFDKQEMLSADRLVLRLSCGEHIVTDRDLVRTLAREVLTATSTEDYCCGHLNSGSFSFYKGDELIRKMRYIDNHMTLVYPADASHWVLFGKEGHCQFSYDTEQRLNQHIHPLIRCGKITDAVVTSLPEGHEYSFQGDDAQAIADYLSGLTLERSFKENPDHYSGMTWVITLTYSGGSVATVYHFANMFIRAEGGSWYQMQYEEAASFDALLAKLNS